MVDGSQENAYRSHKLEGLTHLLKASNTSFFWKKKKARINRKHQKIQNAWKNNMLKEIITPHAIKSRYLLGQESEYNDSHVFA
jgi:hypothetical protein